MPPLPFSNALKGTLRCTESPQVTTPEEKCEVHENDDAADTDKKRKNTKE
jgi:hypothetical protein